ncbi:hypothetical protein Prudu_005630 [Prunus dulcis]|uniref:Uncharacterized protein n=1 Tax=Prunus dulcis TaxID=3755 RepID=A0A4Y1QXZ6_PRUDU|nr:hypothetical protein Prudu_005630 [Prunus dulcis]
MIKYDSCATLISMVYNKFLWRRLQIRQGAYVHNIKNAIERQKLIGCFGILGGLNHLLDNISKQQGNFGWVQANCRKAKERGYFIKHKPRRKNPGGTGSVKWGPISKEQEDEVEWVRAQLSETKHECGNLVTQKNLLQSGLLQGMAGIIRGARKWRWTLMRARCRSGSGSLRAKKAEKGAGKRPRDDDEDRVADVLGKRKALEEAHQHVMGSGLRLLPFDLQAPPKLPFCMEEDVFAEGVEKVDFGRLCQQKKEVPLVNVFLEGVKSDPKALGDPSLFLHRPGPKDNPHLCLWEGSKFLEIDVFGDVYVRAGNELVESFIFIITI